MLQNGTAALPDDILDGPAFTNAHHGIPDGLVQLDLSSAEMCFADGVCTKAANRANGLVEYTELFETPCNHEERYRPAYELVDGSLERAGRASSSQTTKLVERQNLQLQSSS